MGNYAVKCNFSEEKNRLWNRPLSWIARKCRALLSIRVWKCPLEFEKSQFSFLMLPSILFLRLLIWTATSVGVTGDKLGRPLMMGPSPSIPELSLYTNLDSELVDWVVSVLPRSILPSWSLHSQLFPVNLSIRKFFRQRLDSTYVREKSFKKSLYKYNWYPKWSVVYIGSYLKHVEQFVLPLFEPSCRKSVKGPNFHLTACKTKNLSR
jgi:hypothetical protein